MKWFLYHHIWNTIIGHNSIYNKSEQLLINPCLILAFAAKGCRQRSNKISNHLCRAYETWILTDFLIKYHHLLFYLGIQNSNFEYYLAMPTLLIRIKQIILSKISAFLT